MKNQDRRIFILGAGPVGLVSAWEFLKRGESVTIFEAQDRVGGMCRTWQWGDFLVDTGLHIFHTPETSLAEYWEDHFSDLFIHGDFWCQNVSGEKFEQYWDYPISWESISRYEKSLRKKILGEIAKARGDLGSTATNYSDYMRSQLGRPSRECSSKHIRKRSGVFQRLNSNRNFGVSCCPPETNHRGVP